MAEAVVFFGLDDANAAWIESIERAAIWMSPHTKPVADADKKKDTNAALPLLINQRVKGVVYCIHVVEKLPASLSLPGTPQLPRGCHTHIVFGAACRYGAACEWLRITYRSRPPMALSPALRSFRDPVLRAKESSLPMPPPGLQPRRSRKSRHAPEYSLRA